MTLLNPRVTATFEKPTLFPLFYYDESRRLPATFGNNWCDHFFSHTHDKNQLLHQESKGKERFLGDSKRHPLSIPDSEYTSPHQVLKALLAGRYRHHKSSPYKHLEEENRAVYLTLDDKTLRFLAYFEESVPESPKERMRIRKVILRYHPEDETISIFEPEINNSGIRGGPFLNRIRVPVSVRQRLELPEDAYVNINHLSVGRWVDIFDKHFYIYDCDGITRKFLATIGLEQQPGELPSEDEFSKYYSSRRDVYSQSRSFGIRSGNYYPLESERKRRFIEDGDKRLRFRGQFDNRGEVGGAVHDLAVNYFLEDDTIMICEKQSTEDETKWQFLKRMRLPRDGDFSKASEVTFAARVNGQRDYDLGKGPEVYYTAKDLFIGATINVLGRNILLTDCDLYTREYYRDQLGITLSESIAGLGVPATLNNIRLETQKSLPKTDKDFPPHTGFGEYEDSKASCGPLMVKPPKNPAQLSEDDNVLRYEIVRHNPQDKDDNMRRFILNYYVKNGEIMIQESAARNTGYMSGCFLKRQLLRMNPDEWQDEPKFLKLEDLQMGRILDINHFKFRVVNCDQHTKDYLTYHETQKAKILAGVCPHADPVKPERLQYIMEQLETYVRVRFTNLTDAFRSFDVDKDNKITKAEMYRELKYHNICNTESEALALLKYLDKSKIGYVCYTDWMSIFGGTTSAASASTSSDKTSSQAPSPVVATTAQMGEKSGNLTVSTSASEAQQQEQEQTSTERPKLAPKGGVHPMTTEEVELQRYTANAQLKQEEVLRNAVLRRLREKLENRHMNCFEMFRSISVMPRVYKGLRSEIKSLMNIDKDCNITLVQLKRCVQEILDLQYSEKEMAILLKFFFPAMDESLYGRTRDDVRDYVVKLPEFQDKFVEMVKIGTLESPVIAT